MPLPDFLRFCSPEQRARIEERRAAFECDKTEARAYTDDELCEKMQQYLGQTEFAHRWLPGDPVYDGVIAHVLIPEMIRRLKNKTP